MLEFLRKDLLLVLALTAVFVSLSYAIGYVTKEPVMGFETQPAFLEGDRAPRAQPATGRTFKEQALEKVLTVGTPKVTDPMIMRVGGNGEIYILDWADFRIKRFSPAGNLLSVFGNGKGTGDGAFANPTSFSIASNGELWVSDPPQKKLTHFQPDGKAQTVWLRKGLDRVVALEDALVTMTTPTTAGLFEIYNRSGTQLRSFGEFLQNQSQQGFILDGEITADEGGGFVYGGRYAGVIAAYSVDGNPRFVVHTIDRNPVRKVLHVGDKLKVSQEGEDSVLSISVLGDYVYALSGARVEGAESRRGNLIDAYDKRNGQYVFSLRLPVSCREAVVHSDFVYTLGDDGVTVWRVRQSSS